MKRIVIYRKCQINGGTNEHGGQDKLSMLLSRERSEFEKQLKIIIKQHKEQIHVFIKHKTKYTQASYVALRNRCG